VKYYKLAKWEIYVRNVIFVVYILCQMRYSNMVRAPYSIFISVGVLIAVCYLSKVGRILFYIFSFIDLVMLPLDFIVTKLNKVSDKQEFYFLLFMISECVAFGFVLFLNIRHRNDVKVASKSKEAKRGK
jgi:hypothetical protein